MFGLSADHLFLAIQVIIALFFIVLLILKYSRSQQSQFKSKEADKGNQRSKKSPLDLAKAKLNVPLQLDGINIHGKPHEILGIQPNASLEEIQKAYYLKMKQYHPDKIAKQGSDQWNEAQAIAAAINKAKDTLIKNLKDRESL